MQVLVTGAHGFIAKNLIAHLCRRQDTRVIEITRESSADVLERAVAQSDFVFHLAGVNRPTDPGDFQLGNVDFTQRLCESLLASGRGTPILFTSSTQAAAENPYGVSKQAAERLIFDYGRQGGARTYVYRLPNVFGKWCRPNYNSVVATFCHHIARDEPIRMDNPAASLTLVYIDDVVSAFLAALEEKVESGASCTVEPQYSLTVGALAEQLRAFRASRDSLVTERVGVGLARALYATYVSALPLDHFSYTVPKYEDPRGTFVEMLKTRDSGQFSFFTAHPGVTRGGHYHHTKTEKFLVIKGQARFRFSHLVSGDFHELFTSGNSPEIVETIPGWAHDITNVGSDEMVVMLWANEIFDRARPDTYTAPVSPP
jgi:UDP-2-acetamido-2,6-beta-L-arabino-hexul-4-ose reductase